MEARIRALIVPLCERLINQLTDRVEASQCDQLMLMALEVLLAKLLAQVAWELLVGLLVLVYEHARPAPVTRHTL